MAAFDNVAVAYDETFTHSLIGQYQRGQVYRQLSELLHGAPVDSILEINCGTGEDALWLASQNFKVTASDISASMIAVAKQKDENGLVEFQVADINSIAHHFAGKKFDLVFSNFGGLNCLKPQQLQAFLKSVPDILSDNGKLALVIMPKSTLWERHYFMAKGDFRMAVRRTRGHAMANLDGKKVETFYYNPAAVKAMAKSNFTCKKVRPIGFFVPPSYLEPAMAKRPKFLAALDKLDHSLQWLPVARYADHYLIILEKK